VLPSTQASESMRIPTNHYDSAQRYVYPTFWWIWAGLLSVNAPDLYAKTCLCNGIPENQHFFVSYIFLFTYVLTCE